MRLPWLRSLGTKNVSGDEDPRTRPSAIWLIFAEASRYPCDTTIGPLKELVLNSSDPPPIFVNPPGPEHEPVSDNVDVP